MVRLHCLSITFHIPSFIVLLQFLQGLLFVSLFVSLFFICRTPGATADHQASLHTCPNRALVTRHPSVHLLQRPEGRSGAGQGEAQAQPSARGHWDTGRGPPGSAISVSSSSQPCLHPQLCFYHCAHGTEGGAVCRQPPGT